MSLRRAGCVGDALGRALGVAALLVIVASADRADAQPKATAPPAPAGMGETANVGQGLAWSALKPAQREALKPLERDWASIDGLRKRKWLEIAERYPSLSAQDQARLQARMTEWARLTPLERGQVRLNFQEAKQAPAQDRQASWEAYQALPPEQRRALADRAAPPAAAPSRTGPSAQKPASAPPSDKRSREAPQAKSNTVPDRTLTALPKPVAPSVVQVQPGATTTLMSRPPAPPAHQRTGLPKIAATPEYVDKSTLLPQQGAQRAAPPAVTVSAPSPRP
jgi:Protein of unknown function (DUF3106)